MCVGVWATHILLSLSLSSSLLVWGCVCLHGILSSALFLYLCVCVYSLLFCGVCFEREDQGSVVFVVLELLLCISINLSVHLHVFIYLCVPVYMYSWLLIHYYVCLFHKQSIPPYSEGQGVHVARRGNILAIFLFTYFRKIIVCLYWE